MFGFKHSKREGWHGHGFHGHHAGPRGGWAGRGERWKGWKGGAEDDEGGRGGGRRRMFDSGELRLVLLKLIAEKPRHGYDLIRAIEERTGGAYAPSPGIVYPTLTMLSEMGLIDEQSAEGARKQFAVTPEGTAHLAEHEAELTATFARLDALGAMRERTDAVPIRRALHNLRSVLHARLGEGLSKDRMHDAAALIDEVAQKIERL
jgi:DNA-binding PadR family transcriptional regulator